jgi:hypothetical protein
VGFPFNVNFIVSTMMHLTCYVFHTILEAILNKNKNSGDRSQNSEEKGS